MIQAPSQLTREASSLQTDQPSCQAICDVSLQIGNEMPLEIGCGKLSGAEIGSWVCSEINGPRESVSRMRSLGICVGRPLDLVSVGDPMIVQVGTAQIGLSRYLASHVTVRACDRVGCTEQGRCLDQDACVVPVSIPSVSSSSDHSTTESSRSNEFNSAVS